MDNLNNIAEPQIKRFEVQKDDWARERVIALRDSVKEMRKENPETVGFVGFGSLFKGESRPDTDPDPSDIDGFLFVNPDAVSNDLIVVQGQSELENGSLNMDNYKFGDEDRDHYKNLLVEKLKARHSLSDAQVKDIKVLPISTNIIDEIFVRLEPELEKRRLYEKELERVKEENDKQYEIYDKKVKDYKDGLIKEYPRYPQSENFPENFNIGVLPQNISAIFKLSVGGNSEIKFFRNYVLNKLVNIDIGNHLWEGIAYDADFGTKENSDGLPLDLNKAIEKYKSNIKYSMEQLQDYQKQGFLFHGSSNGEIEILEPRTASDTDKTNEFNNDDAIFASPNIPSAIAFAIFNREYIPENIRDHKINIGFYQSEEGDFVKVSIPEKWLPYIEKHGEGFIYVLPSDTFTESKSLQRKSKIAVKPIDKIKVDLDEFYSMGGKLELIKK